MSPRRSPLALVRHLIEISPGGTLAAVEATAASSSPESPRDLYLPAEEVREVLIQQGILAGPLDSNARRAKLGTELPASVAFERLEEPSAADIRAIDAFEDRVRKLRGARGLDKSLPWLGHLIDRNAIPATTTGKGSKRNVNAVERTKGQLPTPAPSVESTPEPVPPPLKRAKSSQLVTTVSNLSISSSTPSTPASSPGLASPAPSALIPPDSSTLSARETVVDAKVATAKAFELATLRRVYETAQREGGASFLALDVEFWERDQQILTEFGWSVLEFVRHPDGTVTERREDQHAIVKESQRYRNGRFAPDARDHFDFGRSIVIPSRGIYYLLHALISTLSATHPLFVVFHDPRGDLRALRQLGIDTQTEFQSDFMQYGKQKKVDQPGGGIWIVDTQRIFSAWLDRKSQIGLEKACVEVAVPTKRLHNAGNDAHYTLALLERLMDRSRRPAPDSAIIKHLDERAAIARQAKADALAQKQAKIESDAKREREEQAALKRD